MCIIFAERTSVEEENEGVSLVPGKPQAHSAAHHRP